VTITGTNFESGSRIVIGDQIYTDGINGTSVVDPMTITLTTLATVAGMHDVVVYDPSGIEDRLVAAYEAAALPTVSTVFPIAGETFGGTLVTLVGQDFQAGAAVRIDGVDQGTVTFVDDTRITFTTVGGAVGGPYILEVENPDAGLATSAFSYAALPDPQLTMILPTVGADAGGTLVTLTGANFSGTPEVYFGADPDTGLGGDLGVNVNLIDANTIEVETPQHIVGLVSVLVRDPVTGQAGLLPDAFTFVGGGGGGCYMVPYQGPQSPGTILAGLWWILAVFLVLHVRARRQRLALSRA